MAVLILWLVTAPATALTLVDESGEPVAGAAVEVLVAAGGDDLLSRLTRSRWQAASGEDGRVPLALPAVEAGLLVVDDGRRLPAVVAWSGEPPSSLVLAAGARREVRAEAVGEIAAGEVCARWPDERPRLDWKTVWRRCAPLAADGTAQLAGLPEGRVMLRVDADGYLPLEVEAGPDERPPLRLERGVLIEGVVERGRQVPVPGAELRAAGSRTTSADDGSFRLAVRELPVSVEAVAAGFRPLRRRVEEPAPLRLTLEPATQLVGQVVDGEGSPVVAAALRLEHAGEGGRRHLLKRSLDHPEGRFRIDLPAAGEYALTVAADGYRDLRLGELRIASGESYDVGLLALERGAGVRGRLIDAAGEPLAGTEVRVMPLGVGGMVAARDGGVRAAVSDEEGAFEIRGLAEDGFELRAERAGFAPVSIRFDAEPQATTDLGDLVLDRGIEIDGRVVGRDGEPRAGLRVGFWSAAQDSVVPLGERVTDGEGRFAGPSLTPGRFRVTVDGERRLLVQEVEVPAEDTVHPLELAVGGVELRGTVLRSGEVVAGGRVRLAAALDPGAQRGKFILSGRHGESVATGMAHSGVEAAVGSDGGFVAEDVPAGLVWLTHLSPAGEATSRRLRVPDRAAARVTVVLDGHRLSGRVSDADGGGGLAAWLRLVAAEGRAVAQRSTAPDGRFELEDLEAGRYVLEVSAEGYVSRAVDIEVGLEPRPLEVALETGDRGALEVSIRRGGGEPAAHVMTTLLSRSGRMVRSLTTDARGQRRFEHLPPDDYFLVWNDPVGGTGSAGPLRVDGEGSASVDRVVGEGVAVEVACDGESCRNAAVEHLAVYSESGVEIGAYLSGMAPAMRFSEDGTLSLGRLAPGRYHLRVWQGGRVRDRTFVATGGRLRVGLD